MKKIALSAVLLLGLTLSGLACRSETPFTEGPDLPFENTTWDLVEYGREGEVGPLLGERRITITFDSNNQRYGGSDGCNGFGGIYELSTTGSLVIYGATTTLLLCPDKIANYQMEQFHKILNSAITYRLENRQLILSGSEGILVFKP